MAIRSLDIAATGMVAQQQNVDAISHNLANINTNGYKESELSFQDLLYQSDARVGSVTGESGDRLPSGIHYGLGVAVAGIAKNFQQGALKSTTGSELNVAISGSGFLAVTLPDGNKAYTRDGNLQVNHEGTIVTAQGYEISPGISIPDDTIQITISKNGVVQAARGSANNTTIDELGTLDLANFINSAGLAALGNNLYQETDASGPEIAGTADTTGFGSILQHFLEESNVNAINAMTTLIKAQRAYEMNSKVVQASEQILKVTTETKA